MCPHVSESFLRASGYNNNRTQNNESSANPKPTSLNKGCAPCGILLDSSHNWGVTCQSGSTIFGESDIMGFIQTLSFYTMGFTNSFIRWETISPSYKPWDSPNSHGIHQLLHHGILSFLYIIPWDPPTP